MTMNRQPNYYGLDGGADLLLPLELDRPRQAALDLYGFEIISATRYFDDTVILAKQSGQVRTVLLTLSDPPDFWAAEFKLYAVRNES